MKTIATTFFLVWTSLIFIVPPALSGNRLPVPPTIRNPDKQNPELLKLKKLLDDGQIIPFYQAANSILNEMSLYRKKNVTPEELQDGLLLCSLITNAPFIDINRHSNVVWLMNYTDMDYEVKDTMSHSIPFVALTDTNTKLPEKEEALRFYISATALILKQFRSSIDYAFDATWIYSELLMRHAPQFTRDLEAGARFGNRLVTNEARNNKLKNIIRRQETGFIKELMQCFPTKAGEVKKYLRMAGYKDKEIPALLDRTVGRIPKASYLYKGLPKSRD